MCLIFDSISLDSPLMNCILSHTSGCGMIFFKFASRKSGTIADYSRQVTTTGGKTSHCMEAAFGRISVKEFSYKCNDPRQWKQSMEPKS